MAEKTTKFIQILRIPHWSKNVFIFAALIFGKKLIGPADEVLLALAGAGGGFFCFSLAASAVYIFNDLIDRKVDIFYPHKAEKPIASGEVGVGSAIVLAIVCAMVALISSYMLSTQFAQVILTYLLIMVCYSLWFKQIMILDCVIIAIGFCLRAIAGAILVGVFISPWLIICTFTLCLFIGFGKRRSELAILGDTGQFFRNTLAGYTPELLTHMLSVTGGLAIVCFLLYAMDDRTYRLFGSNDLVYTTPFVLYCVFRFSALIQKGSFSSPVQLILKDKPFQAGFLLWVLACILVIYAGRLGINLHSIWAH